MLRHHALCTVRVTCDRAVRYVALCTASTPHDTALRYDALALPEPAPRTPLPTHLIRIVDLPDVALIGARDDVARLVVVVQRTDAGRLFAGAVGRLERDLLAIEVVLLR